MTKPKFEEFDIFCELFEPISLGEKDDVITIVKGVDGQTESEALEDLKEMIREKDFPTELDNIKFCAVRRKVDALSFDAKDFKRLRDEVDDEFTDLAAN